MRPRTCSFRCASFWGTCSLHHWRSSGMGRSRLGSHRNRRPCCIATARWMVAVCRKDPKPCGRDTRPGWPQTQFRMRRCRKDLKPCSRNTRLGRPQTEFQTMRRSGHREHGPVAACPRAGVRALRVVRACAESASVGAADGVYHHEQGSTAISSLRTPPQGVAARTMMD